MNVETFALGSFTCDVVKVVDCNLFYPVELFCNESFQNIYYNFMVSYSVNLVQTFMQTWLVNITFQLFIHKSLVLISFAELIFSDDLVVLCQQRTGNWRWDWCKLQTATCRGGCNESSTVYEQRLKDSSPPNTSPAFIAWRFPISSFHWTSNKSIH